MGFAPNQVDKWLPYQADTVYRSWLKANSSPGKPKAPSPQQFRDAVAGMMH